MALGLRLVSICVVAGFYGAATAHGETVDLLRDAAAQGQAKGDQMDKVQAPGREPPERDRSIVKPFEIGI